MENLLNREAWSLAETDLQKWRTRVLSLVLIIVSLAGLPAFTSVVTNAYLTDKLSPLIVAYGAVYAGYVALAFLRRVPVTIRAWLFIGLTYAITAASLARVGLAGSGRLYLVFLPALSIVLLGQRMGYLCLGVSLFEYAIFSELARLGILARWLTDTRNPLDLGSWIESGAALAVILITMTVMLERFFARHVFTLAVSHRITGELEKAYKTLTQRVKDRTRELALLNSVAAVASGLTDIRATLAVTLERTVEAFGLEGCGAYGLDEHTGSMIMLAHKGLSGSFVSQMVRLDLKESLAGKAISFEEPLSWDINEYPDGKRREFLETEGIQRIIGVPLAAKGKLVGGFVIVSRSDRVLSPEESSLLMAVGQQIGMAMENARLLEAQRLQREEAERRREVAEGMRETLAVLNSDKPP
ncbi:MAG TPA: GAF domain-containing protein, partial [Spirochaetia bacterium]|nr:GAF domain-containing protein [Spirochaetia bacterium]